MEVDLIQVPFLVVSSKQNKNHYIKKSIILALYYHI